MQKLLNPRRNLPSVQIDLTTTYQASKLAGIKIPKRKHLLNRPQSGRRIVPVVLIITISRVPKPRESNIQFWVPTYWQLSFHLVPAQQCAFNLPSSSLQRHCASSSSNWLSVHSSSLWSTVWWTDEELCCM